MDIVNTIHICTLLDYSMLCLFDDGMFLFNVYPQKSVWSYIAYNFEAMRARILDSHILQKSVKIPRSKFGTTLHWRAIKN